MKITDKCDKAYKEWRKCRKKSKFQKEQDAKSVHFGVVVVEVINVEE